MNPQRTFGVLPAVATMLLGIASPAAAESAGRDAGTPVWGACAAGNVCFYTGSNGTGSKCSWSVADPDWRTGSIVCSWAATTNVRSVWNNGTSSSYSGVRYYLSAN